MNEKFDELKRRLERWWTSPVSVLPGLGSAGAHAGRSGRLRAEESATLERLVHERFTSPEIGRLLDELRSYEDGLDPDSDEASLIRVTRRDWEKARKVPTELRGEMAHAAARRCRSGWRRAGTPTSSLPARTSSAT